MTEKKSVLEDLYSDSGAFDTKRVVEVLKPILSIKRGGQEIFFTGEGHSLKNEDKMLAYCLVKKLLKSEGLVEDAGVSGKEVHEQTEVPKGTVDPAMQKLKKEGFLAGSGKSYEIPARKVETILQRLEAYRA
jgi:biotin operon repressor